MVGSAQRELHQGRIEGLLVRPDGRVPVMVQRRGGKAYLCQIPLIFPTWIVFLIYVFPSKFHNLVKVTNFLLVCLLINQASNKWSTSECLSTSFCPVNNFTSEYFKIRMEEELTELASKVKLKAQYVETDVKDRNAQTASARNII